jgi:hypothetical protein
MPNPLVFVIAGKKTRGITMSRLISAILLSGALSLPLVVLAQDHDQNQHDQRYYDKSHKDYHQWNANEDRAYHEFAHQRHIKNEDWSHASKRQQQEYWSWRHEHPDAH